MPVLGPRRFLEMEQMMQMNSQPQTALSRGRTNRALTTLFLSMFVLGSGELLVVGLLNLIAADFGSPSPWRAFW